MDPKVKAKVVVVGSKRTWFIEQFESHLRRHLEKVKATQDVVQVTLDPNECVFLMDALKAFSPGSVELDNQKHELIDVLDRAVDGCRLYEDEPAPYAYGDDDA